MGVDLQFGGETKTGFQTPKTYDDLLELIQESYQEQIPERVVLQYDDCDGDRVMLVSEEDYQALLTSESEMAGKNVVIHISPADNLMSQSSIISIKKKNQDYEKKKKEEQERLEKERADFEKKEKDDERKLQEEKRREEEAIKREEEERKRKEEQMMRAEEEKRELDRLEAEKQQEFERLEKVKQAKEAADRKVSEDLNSIDNEAKKREEEAKCKAEALSRAPVDPEALSEPGRNRKSTFDKVEEENQSIEGNPSWIPQMLDLMAKRFPSLEQGNRQLKMISTLKNVVFRYSALPQQAQVQIAQHLGDDFTRLMEMGFNQFKASPYSFSFVKEVSSIPKFVNVSTKQVYKNIVLRNTGTEEWPKRLKLKCLNSPNQAEATVESISPKQEAATVIQIFPMPKEGEQEFIWTLGYVDDTSEFVYLGQPFKIMLRVEPAGFMYSEKVQENAKALHQLFPDDTLDSMMKFSAQNEKLDLSELVNKYFQDKQQ